MKKITLAISAAALSLSAIGTANADQLDAAAVKALFSGKTVTAYHTRKEIDLKVYYDPNGKVYGMRDDSIWQRHWKVQDDGVVCIINNELGKEFCRIIRKVDGKYYKYKVKGNGDQIRIVEYKKFEDGNTENYKWVD